jgi:uncharacterized protein (DUF2141 family)
MRCITIAVLGGLAWLAGGGTAVAAPEEIVPETMAAVQSACREQPFSLLVIVRKVRNDRGIITIDLHNDDPEKWLKKGSRIGRVRVPARPGDIEVCVPVPGQGRYAAALYHDRDTNFKLNKNFIGLPSEPYAVTRDPPINFGPPSLKDSLVDVTGPQTRVDATLHN